MTKGYERTKGQLESDAEFVAKHYKWGWSLRRIARALSAERKEYDLSHHSVKKHVDALLQEWRDNRVDDMDKAIQAELEKLNLIESEAWEAWNNSKLEDGGPVHQFLDKVEKCITRRCQILGLDAPKKQSVSSEVTISERPDLSGLSDEDIDKMMEILGNK